MPAKIDRESAALLCYVRNTRKYETVFAWSHVAVPNFAADEWILEREKSENFRSHAVPRPFLHFFSKK